MNKCVVFRDGATGPHLGNKRIAAGQRQASSRGQPARAAQAGEARPALPASPSQPRPGQPGQPNHPRAQLCLPDLACLPCFSDWCPWKPTIDSPTFACNFPTQGCLAKPLGREMVHAPRGAGAGAGAAWRGTKYLCLQCYQNALFTKYLVSQIH